MTHDILFSEVLDMLEDGDVHPDYIEVFYRCGGEYFPIPRLSYSLYYDETVTAIVRNPVTFIYRINIGTD